MYNYQVSSTPQFPTQGFATNQLPAVLPSFNTNALPTFNTQPQSGFVTNQFPSFNTQPQQGFMTNQLTNTQPTTNQLPSFNTQPMTNQLPSFNTQSGFSSALPPIAQYQPNNLQSSLPTEIEQPPTQLEQIIQPIEENQRPTAFVSRIYNTDISMPVPPEVLEYRKLSREERALKQTNPRLLTAMAIRCTDCKKVINQLNIERALLTGQSLRDVMDSQNYIRICCRKQIQNEPAVVNIQNQMATQQNTVNLMNNLTLANTSAALTGRNSFNTLVPIQSKMRILDSAPPGMVQDSIQIFGQNNIAIGDSFAGASPMQMRDSYSISVSNLNHDNADEY